MLNIFIGFLFCFTLLLISAIFYGTTNIIKEHVSLEIAVWIITFIAAFWFIGYAINYTGFLK